MPDPSVEELDRPVPRLGLDVLRQRDGHRSGVGRVGQCAHRAEQHGRKLLGSPHPVEEHRHRAQRVVDGYVVAARGLELLQDCAAGPGGKDVARQQQHGDPVDRRQCGPGDQVGRARPHGSRTSQCLQAVPHPRETDRGVHHALLVAALEVPQRLVVALGLRLHQRLTESGDVAVTEDAEAAFDQPVLDPVTLGVLPREELHDGLGHGQRDRLAHRCPPNGSRGSIFWEAHVWRTHA